ncbi:hypothetical protein BGZ58_010410 [Dissophora ornata]|nr:hypothetical protein BGZ58_010410 [Dissophora ornata]
MLVRGKGKWGAQPPAGASQTGLSPSNPAPQSSVPNVTSSPNKDVLVSEVDSKHMHDRMLFLLSNMIGMSVEITVKNGSKYEGIFHTAFTEGELGVVLRLAKITSGKDKKDGAPLVSQIIILGKECMAINVLDVDFVPHERSGPERGEREGFKTDTDISRSGEIKERDLKKWAPDEQLTFGGIEDGLGDGRGNGRAGWDQFAANERLFGVKTDFDEELYTTKLDRSGADFKAREQQAIQIANEIQQSVSTNVHMREERGLAVDDSGLDEEDLYGAVVREPIPVSNKYMPPAMRRQQELNQQKRTPTSAQSPARSPAPTPQVPSAPIAQGSQGVQPTNAPAQQNQPSPSPKPAPTEKTPTAPVSGAGASVSRSNSTKGGNAQFNLNDLRTHNPVSTIANAATIQGSKNQQIPDHAVDAKQIEDNLAKFKLTARTFATNDKALVNQTKMGLTQRRSELIQQKKDGLAAELKQFGKELTKKLNTPVPDDVKEIFGKKSDQSSVAEKPKETLAAKTTDVESAQEKKTPITENKDANTDATKPSATSQTPVAAEKSAADKAKSGSSFKFNIKASVFKPNVNAAPFTPSFASAERKSNATVPGVADKNLFFGKPIKKGPLSLEESMSRPFKKGQTSPSPASITPIWPYGQRAFRHLFQVTNRYEEDMLYNQGMGQHGGNNVGGYYSMAPYNYGPSGQFGVPPPMTMAGPNHMVPFLATAGPVPFSQPPPPPGMPHSGAGPAYPQMAPTSSGGPVMMRYPPPDMMPPMGPNSMMMHHRPIGVDPQIMHYPPGAREAGTDERASDANTGS